MSFTLCRGMSPWCIDSDMCYVRDGCVKYFAPVLFSQFGAPPMAMISLFTALYMTSFSFMASSSPKRGPARDWISMDVAVPYEPAALLNHA